MQIKIGEKHFWLNFHHLYYFWVVASEGGISSASRKLRLGPPTLSAQIKQFEESLGATLFHRSNRKLHLTETGHAVREYAQEIFRMGAEMVENLHDRLPAHRIHVQIGAIDGVSKHLILEVVRAARNTGDCLVTVVEGRPVDLIRELNHHKVDLLISNDVPTTPGATKMYSKKIGSSPIVVCGSKKFLPLRKNFPASLSGAPFILPTIDSRVRHDLDHYFRLAGIHPDIVAESQDTAIQKLMGVDGMGLIPMTETAVKDLIRRKDLFEIGRINEVWENVFLVASSRKISNPISLALIKSFRMPD